MVDDAAATDIYGNLETPPIDEDAAELASQIDEPKIHAILPLKLLSRRTLGELSHSKYNHHRIFTLLDGDVHTTRSPLRGRQTFR